MGQCRPIKISSPPKVSAAVTGNIRRAVEGAVARNRGLSQHLRKPGLNLENAEIRIQRRGGRLSVNLFYRATGSIVCLPSDVVRAVKKVLSRNTRALVVPAKTKATPKPAPRPASLMGGLAIGNYRPNTTLRIKPKASQVRKLTYRPGKVYRNTLGNRLARQCQALTSGYRGYTISIVFTKAEMRTTGIKTLDVNYRGTRKPPLTASALKARILKYIKSRAFQTLLISEQDYSFNYPATGLARLAQR
jgi:hypothetical protein